MSELKSLFLGSPRLTLGVAESLTSGQVQARIGAISGASNFFCGGVTTYTLDRKVQLLNVARAVAEPVNSVSAEVALQMARGVCRLFACSVGVATTGYAEPAPSRQVETPFAHWAIVLIEPQITTDRREIHGRVEGPGLNRVAMQNLVADSVLDELLGALRSWRSRV